MRRPEFQVVPVENEIRTNLTITDKHGLTVNLNEARPTLSKAEVARVEKCGRGDAGPRRVADDLRQHSAGRAAVVLRAARWRRRARRR